MRARPRLAARHITCLGQETNMSLVRDMFNAIIVQAGQYEFSEILIIDMTSGQRGRPDPPHFCGIVCGVQHGGFQDTSSLHIFSW